MTSLNLQLLSFFFLIISLSAYGQQADYCLRHYNDENGLPQNSVKFIFADKDGFVWLSTEDGLARFDGHKFIKFGKDNMKVSSNRFQTIFPDHGNEKIYSYTSKYEQVHINGGNATRDYNKTDWLRQKEKADSNLIQATCIDGLYYINKELKQTLKKILIPLADKDYCIYDGDTISFHHQNKTSQRYAFRTTSDWNFFVLNNRLYLIQHNGQTDCFQPRQKSGLLEGDILPGLFYRNATARICVFWNICVREQAILYTNGSFYAVTEKEPGLLTTRLLFSGFNAEKSNICSAFYNNASGELYLGSSTAGMFVLSPHIFTCLTSGKKENVYYAQAIYSGNKVFTPQDVLFDLAGKEKEQVLPARTKDDFATMLIDGQQNIWKKWGTTLYRYKLKEPGLTGKWQLPDAITVLYKKGREQMWIGLRKGGIYLKNTHSSQPPYLFRYFNEAISCLQQADEHILYAGSEKNLFRIETTTGKVDTVNGLQNKNIRSIYTVGPQEVWITTYGNGFFLYKNNKLTAFPPDRDGYLLTSHCIIKDRLGFFWISTNKGLFQAAAKDLLNYAAGKQQRIYYHYYDRTAGFNTNEFNGGCQPCAVQTGEGYISFPSMNGLVVFRPDSFTAQLPAGRLFVDKIRLNNNTIGETVLQYLPRQFSQLQFFISSPYSGHPKNLQLEYALYENDQPLLWHPVDAGNTITISRLPEGDYTLHIRKINGFGNNNFTSVVYRLRVLTPWYRTPFFYLLYLIVAAAVTALLVRLRLQYIKRRNEELERIVAQKTKALQHQTRLQSKIIHSISHDIQTPLQFHKLLAERLHQALVQKNDQALQSFSAPLQDSARRLHRLVGDMLLFLKSRLSYKIFVPETIYLRELVEEKLGLFKNAADEKAIRLNNLVAPGLTISGDPQLFSIILHNLIDNGLKATGNISVVIDARQYQDKIWLTVSDAGPGLSAAFQAWINEPVKGAEITMLPEGHENSTGLGLIMVKELTAAQGIRLQVQAQPDTGTVFTLECNTAEAGGLDGQKPEVSY